MRNDRKDFRQRVLSRHVKRLDRKILYFQQLDQRYFWIRLGALLFGALVLFFAYQSRQSRLLISAGLAFLAIFSLVVFFNRKVKRSILRFNLSREYFLSQLARLKLAWEKIPPAPETKTDDGHPFAADLNLIGSYSLHQLLNTAVSQGGSGRLQDWLLNQLPDVDQVGSRQAVVNEIQSLIGFRSRLALGSRLVSFDEDEPWDGEKLINWLERKVESRSLKSLLFGLSILAATNITLFVLFTLGMVPALWIFSLAIYAGVYLFTYRNLQEVFSQAWHLSITLDKFRTVLVYLEKYPYKTNSLLHQLCGPFWKPGRRPSSYLREISLIVSAASISSNPVVWLLINVLVPWDVFFGYQLQRYKVKMQDLLPDWLEVWYELEALNSLANFSYLNPGYTFPIIVVEEAKRGTLFDAQALGHPLIPDEDKVSNNFSLNKLGEVVIITGSNMSGKSTFLRTIGINLCLAFAGGPVNADHLRTNLFRLFTVIQVRDSLTDGISYFYAEVRRLKTLLNALEMEHNLPLFFFIDEIFRGTNNRERQIGSRAFVRKLLGGNGVGLISTHDLELVFLADELPNVINYHFQEEVTHGRMIFDYLLRPGPSQTTNALQIMHSEGLPVDNSSLNPSK